jgi:hypothetical protein
MSSMLNELHHNDDPVKHHFTIQVPSFRKSTPVSVKSVLTYSLTREKKKKLKNISVNELCTRILLTFQERSLLLLLFFPPVAESSFSWSINSLCLKFPTGIRTVKPSNSLIMMQQSTLPYGKPSKMFSTVQEYFKHNEM